MHQGDERVVYGRLCGRELSAVPADVDGRPEPIVGRGNRRLECGACLVEIRADRNAKASLEQQLIGNPAGPVAGGETTDEKGIGKLQASHQRMGDISVDDPLVIGQRGVHDYIAVDGRDQRRY